MCVQGSDPHRQEFACDLDPGLGEARCCLGECSGDFGGANLIGPCHWGRLGSRVSDVNDHAH